MNKDINYYLSLPWIFEFEKAESQDGYYARVKGLKCHSYGNNIQEANNNIFEALESHLTVMLENSAIIPLPQSEEDCNGQLNVRVSKSLHKRLKQIADQEGVSLSHIVNDALIEKYA